MDRKKMVLWTLTLGLVLLLVSACSTAQPAAMSQPTPTPETPTWDIVDGSVASTAFGTFNGIPYVQYTGQFVGTEAGDYAVGFEIVAPDDPTQGNGVLVMEPMHITGGTAGRDAYLTREFLFGRGFSYAGIWWHPADVNPMTDYSGGRRERDPSQLRAGPQAGPGNPGDGRAFGKTLRPGRLQN